MYNWINLLYTQNTVNQLYFSKKIKVKKINIGSWFPAQLRINYKSLKNFLDSCYTLGAVLWLLASIYFVLGAGQRELYRVFSFSALRVTTQPLAEAGPFLVWIYQEPEAGAF